MLGKPQVRRSTAAVASLTLAALLTPVAPAAADWPDPVTVSDGSSIPTGPAVVDLDAAGNAIAVWPVDGGTAVARRPADGAWGAPALLSTQLRLEDVALRRDGTALLSVVVPGSSNDRHVLRALTTGNEIVDAALVTYTRTGSYAVVDRADGDVIGVQYTALSKSGGRRWSTAIGVARAEDAPGAWRSVYRTGAPEIEVAPGPDHTYWMASFEYLSGPFQRLRLDLVSEAGKVLRHEVSKKLHKVVDIGLSTFPDGKPVLAWTAKEDNTTVLRAMRVVSSEQGRKVRTLDSWPEDGFDFWQEVSVFTAVGGKAQVLWARPTDRGHRLLVATSRSGSRWRTPQTLRAAYRNNHPQVTDAQTTGAALVALPTASPKLNVAPTRLRWGGFEALRGFDSGRGATAIAADGTAIAVRTVVGQSVKVSLRRGG